MLEINNIIKINNMNEQDINHLYSIILRAWYELLEMRKCNKIQSFVLNQMENFEISFTGEHFVLSIKKTQIIKDESDMDKIVDKIYKYFSEKYPINYDYRLIDPIYFSLFFYDVVDKIIDIKYDKINISDIKLLRKNSFPVCMDQSERFKALVDQNYKMYSPFKSNLIINTPEERLNNALISILNKGYGYKEQYAIFYNNEPYLRDGQHRIASLKYLYGDIDVKIIRFYLKNNYFYE